LINYVDIAFDSTYLPSSYAKSIETVKKGGSWIVLNRLAQEKTEEVRHLLSKNQN
jgi:hypothetical protein